MAAGAAAVAIAGAVPAYAVTSVTVAAGSATSGTVVPAKLASGTLNLRYLTTLATGTCTSSTLTGITKAGANSAANMAQINGGAGQLTFNGCSYGFGVVKGVGTTKWTIAATGATASGTTPITISGIYVAVSSGSCSFTISGSVAGSFANGNPSKISLPATTTTSKLVVSNIVLQNGATKCLSGFVTPGEKVSLSGTYSVTATNGAYNPVTAIGS